MKANCEYISDIGKGELSTLYNEDGIAIEAHFEAPQERLGLAWHDSEAEYSFSLFILSILEEEGCFPNDYGLSGNNKHDVSLYYPG